MYVCVCGSGHIYMQLTKSAKPYLCRVWDIAAALRAWTTRKATSAVVAGACLRHLTARCPYQ